MALAKPSLIVGLPLTVAPINISVAERLKSEISFLPTRAANTGTGTRPGKPTRLGNDRLLLVDLLEQFDATRSILRWP